MQRFIMSAAVLFGLALGLFLTGGASVSAQDRNCPSFANQQEAQDYFDAGGGSIDFNYNGLDGSPRNGLACDGYFGYVGTGPGGGVTPTATTAPVDPTATTAPVDPTATLAPGELTAVPTDAPIDPTAAPVDPTQAPVDQSTQAPVVVDNGGTDAGTGTGATSSSSVSLPNTGTGDAQSSSMTTMTLVLALFAGACLALGGFGLVRGRRG